MKIPAFKQKKSLTRQTLMQMALSITTMIVLSTTTSYFHLVSSFTNESLQNLEKYIIERGQREQAIFSLAVDNHAILKKDLLQKLKDVSNQDPKDDFERLFVKWEDGAIRNRPETLDRKTQVSTYIGKNVTVNADIRRRVIAFYNLLMTYGPAWYNRFQNTYITAPENISVDYWPDVQWANNAKADLYIPDEEYFWVADQKHNPERKSVWTGLYYDKVANQWMVSCVTPVDIQGKQVATIGHDIVLNQLLERTIKDTLEGTYNIIFRSDGRLIAHPTQMDDIKQQGGNFDIVKSGDRQLQNIFDLVKNNNNNQTIIENNRDNQYLAVTRINEPDWYLVTVLPKDVMSKPAFEAAKFVLTIGIASLLIEILILFYILNNQVAIPLNKLTLATQKIAAGDFDIALDATRQDELGRLASSFNKMSHEVSTREQDLKKAQSEALQLQKAESKARKRAEKVIQNLEKIVAKRTREVTDLNESLKAENIRMKVELDLTRQVQQLILPKEEELAQIPDLDIAGFMQPASQMGGDYYDIIYHNGQVKIGIGDVTGHGLESGMLMMMVQTAVRTLLENNETDPKKFLETLNRTIYHNVQRMNSDKNMTLCLLDYQNGLVRLSGQHEEMLVIRRGGLVQRVDTIDLGFPIGLEKEIGQFVGYADIQLYPGDVVVLYTDGITEAEDINGLQYGLKRLVQVVKDNWKLSAGEIKEVVLDDLWQHIGKQKILDDITLVVLKQKKILPKLIPPEQINS